MKEIIFSTMVFIIVNIQETKLYTCGLTKLYTCGLIDKILEITICKSFLLKELKDTKISIKCVIGNKEMITKLYKKCRKNDL